MNRMVLAHRLVKLAKQVVAVYAHILPDEVENGNLWTEIRTIVSDIIEMKGELESITSVNRIIRSESRRLSRKYGAKPQMIEQAIRSEYREKTWLMTK